MLKRILLYFLFISSFVNAQSITSSVDSTQIKIGSQFNLTIKANVSKTDKVTFPDGKFLGALEVLESYPVDSIKSNDKLQLIKKYGLTQFDSGRYVLPKLAVLINSKTFRTDSFAVIVNDVVVDTIKQQMFDIKPIIKVEKPAIYWWLYLILILIFLAVIGYGAYYFIKKKQNKKNEEEAILFASPIEKAIAQLEALEKKTLWQNGETKGYYSELTDITRNYIEEVIEIPAMESTSSELFEALKIVVRQRNIKISRDTLDKFKNVMATSDLVKFAKSKPLDFEIENDKNTINTFLISLDKAIPRTEEETENLFTEELKRKKERSQKLQRIFIPLTLVGIILTMILVFLGVTKGMDFLRENIIGHSTKSMLKDEWVTSDYGDPAIIISTPKSLTRNNDARIQNNLPENIKATSTFFYGSLLDNFSVVLSTTSFKDSVQGSLDMVLEQKLKQLESFGAQNVIVNTGDYDDPKGLTGKKSEGTFTVLDPISKEDIKMYYSILVFSQGTGIQELTLVHKLEDENAAEIMKRIVESIELRKAVQ
ncbi:hypothetical protein [Flavobacterium sp.]|jgi:hypothetical protein|uniref:hypothetical protein n=1 Tax=Flavobacterium sp. TaxID=239 RepID=UPI002A801C1E|nr:hypothetical protein [Flavobacterium sp.]